MKRELLLAILILSTFVPANADSVVATPIMSDPIIESPEVETQPVILVPIKKRGHTPFCVAHPKIYQKYRKSRKICQSSLPVVQWTAGILEILQKFHIF